MVSSDNTDVRLIATRLTNALFERSENFSKKMAERH